MRSIAARIGQVTRGIAGTIATLVMWHYCGAPWWILIALVAAAAVAGLLDGWSRLTAIESVVGSQDRAADIE